MQENKLLYTIMSVFALILVIVGIVFAWHAYDIEKNKEKENTLIS